MLKSRKGAARKEKTGRLMPTVPQRGMRFQRKEPKPKTTVRTGKNSQTDFDRFKQTFKHESLILAQDERWRRAKHMQVERGCKRKFSDGSIYLSGGRVSNAWVTCPAQGDTTWKQVLKPHKRTRGACLGVKNSGGAGWTRV